jgi:hypothetical protein
MGSETMPTFTKLHVSILLLLRRNFFQPCAMFREYGLNLFFETRIERFHLLVMLFLDSV